jgi:hypothetical protein
LRLTKTISSKPQASRAPSKTIVRNAQRAATVKPILAVWFIVHPPEEMPLDIEQSSLRPLATTASLTPKGLTGQQIWMRRTIALRANNPENELIGLANGLPCEVLRLYFLSNQKRVKFGRYLFFTLCLAAL